MSGVNGHGRVEPRGSRRRSRVLERLDFASLYGLQLRQGSDPHGWTDVERLGALERAIRAHKEATASTMIPRRPADHELYRTLGG